MSKFNGNSGDADLTSGQADAFFKTMRVDSLVANFPVKTNASKTLVSEKIQLSDIEGLSGVITNPYQGTLQADDFKGDSIKDKTETSTINLTATEIDLVATSVKVNGQAFDASVDLQDAYNNSVVAETQLTTTKPYTIKAVDTANLLNIDGDTKEVNINGDLLVNGSNLETQISNVEGDITNLQNNKYDKTGGILTGNLIHNGNLIQFNGASSFQIQNAGSCQIQNTGPLSLKTFSTTGDIVMGGTAKVRNLANGTDPTDAVNLSQIPTPVNITDLETKTQNIDAILTSPTQTFMTQDLKLGTVGNGLTGIGVSGQGEDIAINNVSPNLVGLNGFTFGTTQSILLTRLKVLDSLYLNSVALGAIPFIGLWQFNTSTNQWELKINSSLSDGNVGTENGYRWTENGIVSFSINPGEKWAISYNMLLTQQLSFSLVSPITIGSSINIIGSIYNNVGQGPTFPENETTDGYAPVGSFDYINIDTIDKSLSCLDINVSNINAQVVNTTDINAVEINNLTTITSGNIQLTDIAEPTNALDGQGKLYKKTGNDALFWKADSTGAEVNVLTGVGTPPTATASQITNFNDYSVLTPLQMLSSLTLAGGGVNKCYGNSVRMIADVDLLAGRVVSLSDYSTNITGLRVGYLQTSNETNPVVYPVGITLNNALAGQKVDICTQGLCTGIMSNATTLNRGSVVACTGSTGLVVAGSTISSDVGVLGSIAMGGAILANQPVLLYLQPWYSVF